MAFTTTQGSGANDATSFVGTAGVDTLTVQAQSNPFYVEALDSGDSVLLSNFSNTYVMEDGNIRGGQGNDTITTTGTTTDGITVVNSTINGNQGDDTIGVAATNYSESDVYGGQGDDTLLVRNLYGGFINGNKNTDTITTSNLGTITGQIYGGQGTDTINISGDVNGGGVRGDKDVDILNIGAQAAVLQNFTNATFNGNEGNDQIAFDVRVAASAVSNTTVYGGKGDDVITSAVTSTEEAVFSGDIGNDTITKGANSQNDTLLGGAGTDSITSNLGTNRIEGGADADVITSTGIADTIVQNVGDSNAATGIIDLGTGAALANGVALGAGDTISVDADVVTAFAATDRLSMGTTVSNGVGAAGQSVSATTFAGVNIIYGTFATATNVFTTAATQANGTDCLIFTSAGGINMSSAAAAINTNAIITMGNSANVTAGSFV